MKKIFALIFLMIPLGAAAELIDTETKPFAIVTRREFASIVSDITEKPFRLNRPGSPLILAEAAAVLSKIYNLEPPPDSELYYQYVLQESNGLQKLVREKPPWYKAPLMALGDMNAIPDSFFNIDDAVTMLELAEMISRLDEGITDRPARIFEGPGDFREAGYIFPQSTPQEEYIANFLRIFGDIENISILSLLKSNVIAKLSEPATYIISDAEWIPYYSTKPLCDGEYYSTAVTIIQSEEKTNWQFDAKSVNYCENGKQKPYTLSIEKEGKYFRVRGAQTGRLKIARRSIPKIIVEYGTDGPFYDLTKVETSGTVEVKEIIDAKKFFIYRTVWRPIFNDLRGMPFLKTSETLADGSTWMRIYDTPEHNKNPYGKGHSTYEYCLENMLSPYTNYLLEFCIKREGNSLVLASQKELGGSVTFWIDEHFKR